MNNNEKMKQKMNEKKKRIEKDILNMKISKSGFVLKLVVMKLIVGEVLASSTLYETSLINISTCTHKSIITECDTVTFLEPWPTSLQESMKQSNKL